MNENKITTPSHYQRNDNSDLIAEWTQKRSPVEVRAALMFNIEKYMERYGKKDQPLKEAEKIMNYAVRLWQFEKQLVDIADDVDAATARYFGEV